MTFLEFIQMSQEQQYRLWLGKGLFTASYRQDSRTYLLFQLYSFYVQTSYLAGKPENMLFEPFEDPAFLEPFTANIDLQEIYVLISNPGK